MITTKKEDSLISHFPVINSYFANTFHFMFSVGLIVAFVLNFDRTINFSFQLATISFTVGSLIYGLVGSAEVEDEKDETLRKYLFWVGKRLIESGLGYLMLLAFHSPISALLSGSPRFDIFAAPFPTIITSLWTAWAAMSNIIFTEALIVLMMFFDGELDAKAEQDKE